MNSRLAAARYLVASEKAPYLSTALWSLTVVEREGMVKHGAPGPIGVDQYWRLYYDPDEIKKMSVEVLAGCLVHECWHLLREHAKRFAHVPASDSLRVNLATDEEINDDLQREGIELPAGCVYPKTFRHPEGKVAEWYFQRLLKTGVNIVLGCGSAAHGKRQAWEDAAPNGTNADGRGAVEASLAVRATLQDMLSRGDTPAQFKLFAEAALKVRVDPKLLLARAIRRGLALASGMVDYSYARPARRNITGVVLPILRRPIPSVACVADTSGSMSAEQLGIALGWIDGILATLGYREGVPVLVTDAAVHSQRKVLSARQIELEGGGGTDMRIGIAEAARLKVDLCVILTDGETPWPTERQRMDCLAVIINQDPAAIGEVPGWMRKVVVTGNA